EQRQRRVRRHVVAVDGQRTTHVVLRVAHRLPAATVQRPVTQDGRHIDERRQAALVDRECLLEERFGLLALALLPSDYAQTAKRIRVAAVDIQGLAIRLLGALEVVALQVGQARVVPGRRGLGVLAGEALEDSRRLRALRRRLAEQLL